MTVCCMDVDDDALVRFCDGELTENEAHAFRSHLRECPRCAARTEDMRRTLDVLAAPIAEFDTAAAVDNVMRQLPFAHPDPAAVSDSRMRGVRRWASAATVGALALGAMALASGVLMHHAGDAPGFTARGAPLGVSVARGVSLGVMGGREALLPARSVRPDEAYRVTYTNLLDVPVYALVFAIDSAGAIHWVCPAFLDPKSDPDAFALVPQGARNALPSAIQLDAPAAGPLRFFAVLSTSRTRVSDVDALNGAAVSIASLRALFPSADVRDLVTVHVDSH